jgi:hypothetical protein
MSKYNLKWSFNNSKLGKDKIISFGLPAIKTCPNALKCKAICYATQGCYTFRVVQQAKEFNYKQSKQHSFRNKAILDLQRLKAKYIRIHDSGDFYNQKYLDSWIAISKCFPDKVFYAYTKSLHLDFSKLPSNFKIIQSYGGKLDHLIDTTKSHAKVFTSESEMNNAGYINGNESDMYAVNGTIKIGLVYHGTRKLTDNQKTMLRERA